LGQLLLTVMGSGGMAVTLISVLRDWLTRHQDVKIRVKRGETEIELSGGNPEELKGLLAEIKSLLMDVPVV
jgi:type IV secretory pathway TrbD component